MNEFWNKRYANKEFYYGRTPNHFFKQFIDNNTPGSLLLPSEGEGRNGVYAAMKGWKVFAIDFSETARNKALRWAEENKVHIHYDVEDMDDWDADIQIDSIALIYAHFHSDTREQIHQRLIKKLNPGGSVILEAFSKNQLKFDSGGPKSIDMLYDVDLLKNDFASLTIEYLQERTLELDEGNNHRGEASIIRMIAKKK